VLGSVQNGEHKFADINFLRESRRDWFRGNFKFNRRAERNKVAGPLLCTNKSPLLEKVVGAEHRGLANVMLRDELPNGRQPGADLYPTGTNLRSQPVCQRFISCHGICLGAVARENHLKVPACLRRGSPKRGIGLAPQLGLASANLCFSENRSDRRPECKHPPIFQLPEFHGSRQLSLALRGISVGRYCDYAVFT